MRAAFDDEDAVIEFVCVCVCVCVRKSYDDRDRVGLWPRAPKVRYRVVSSILSVCTCRHGQPASQSASQRDLLAKNHKVMCGARAS